MFFPRAIMHLDADAFFASCEQAVNPALRGRPVITGKERGIVSAASYEAKARGVQRGMRLFEVRKVCPDAVILPSDYETYSLFSIRMFAILQRFTPDVEEYSIDEAFADLTGLRRFHHGSYEAIAEDIRKTMAAELGFTVSVGVSLTKVLAKIGSKHKKPDGLTMIGSRDIEQHLARLTVGKVWGIGPNTAAYLEKFGIKSALDLARKPESFAERHLAKPYREIWHELNGRSVLPVSTVAKQNYQSISKAKTFTPPSTDREFVFAQFAKNLENACIKARRHGLAARKLYLFLRQQDFRDSGYEIKLDKATSYPADLFTALHEGFIRLYRENTPYRQTGVVLADLIAESKFQYTLFDDTARIEKMSRLYQAVDRLSDKFGKHTVQHGASLPTRQHSQHEGDRGDSPERRGNQFQGETARQRLGIPVVKMTV
jgi:DNA polymerase-4/DNA polymerase V